MAANEILLAFKVALQAFAKQEVHTILEAAVMDAVDDFDAEMNSKIEEQAQHVVDQFDKLKMVLLGVIDKTGKARTDIPSVPDVVAGLFLEVAEIRKKGHL